IAARNLPRREEPAPHWRLEIGAAARRPPQGQKPAPCGASPTKFRRLNPSRPMRGCAPAGRRPVRAGAAGADAATTLCPLSFRDPELTRRAARRHRSHRRRGRYRVHGEQVLANLFKLKTFRLEKGAKPEVAIREARAGAARLGGKLDRIDIGKDGVILITDYKTGVPLPSFDSRDQTKAIKAWRHRNQLLFYALLLRQSSRYGKTKTIKGQM